MNNMNQDDLQKFEGMLRNIFTNFADVIENLEDKDVGELKDFIKFAGRENNTLYFWLLSCSTIQQKAEQGAFPNSILSANRLRKEFYTFPINRRDCRDMRCEFRAV